MQVTTRSRLSDARGALGAGMPPIELWGVGTGPHNRKRGDKAKARRAAKRAAKRAGVTLKAFLRSGARWGRS